MTTALEPSDRALRLALPAGVQALLRPAQPADAALAQRFLSSLSARTHHWRFHRRLPALGAVALASAQTLADPRHQALIAVVHENGQERMVADARFVRDSNGREGEFAIVVCESLRRQGLGSALMRGLQQRAFEAGLRWLRGEVQGNDPAMVRLMLSLGFRPARCDESAGLVVFEQRVSARTPSGV